MDPLHSRAREWNAWADNLANYALSTRESAGNLTVQILQEQVFRQHGGAKQLPSRSNCQRQIWNSTCKQGGSVKHSEQSLVRKVSFQEPSADVIKALSCGWLCKGPLQLDLLNPLDQSGLVRGLLL